jgi:DNA-binding NtrC family response regulator
MSTLLKTILVVDPDQEKREYVQRILHEEESFHVEVAPDSGVAHNILGRIKVHVILTALFPNQEGLELLEHVAGKNTPIVPVACLPSGDQEAVVQALNAGAQYYINTPYQPQEVRLIVQRALDTYEKLAQQGTPDLELRKSDGFYGIVGGNKEMHKLFNLIEKVAEDGESTVLIQGESGVGKELVAQALHEHSPRQKQKLVPVNCAAIPEELLESELFGYEKGAFTGANQAKQGRLHYANKGTLFLDEIGDMQPALQAKLLRVLQEKEFEPVGSVKPHKVDVRVVAATRCELEEEVNSGKFREDLYYRLSVVPIRIPPLRERVDDIPLLLDKFVHLYQRNRRGSLKAFSPEAVEVLKNYSWPGNVRELKNLVQRLSILHEKETVDIPDLPEKFITEADVDTECGSTSRQNPVAVTQATGIDFNTQVSEFEDRLILQALIATNGNKKQAAQNLNLKRTTLLEKIKKKNLDKLYLQYLDQQN